MMARIKAYIVNRLASDWGDSPWYVRFPWAMLRVLLRSA
jgi:hypothetical protein